VLSVVIYRPVCWSF